MKKMLFAAMVACAAGAYAQCVVDSETPPPDTDYVYVYDFKASLKTPIAKYASVTEKADCTATGKSPTFYRVKGSLTLKGLVIACGGCADLAPGEGNFYTFITSSTSKYTNGYAVPQTEAQFLMLNYFGSWTYKKATTAQGYLSIPAYYDWTETILNADLEPEIQPRIFDLRAAGFGTRFIDGGAGVVQSISGQMVGLTASPALYVRNCTSVVPALCFTPCDMAVSCEYEGDSMPSSKSVPWRIEALPNEDVDYVGDVAFGSWSMKLNKSLSKYAVDHSALQTAQKAYPKVAWLDSSATLVVDNL